MVIRNVYKQYVGPHCPVVAHREVDCVWNMMVHAQKPDFFFRRNGRVNLNRRGRQFSRLLAAEVCASAVVTLDTPSSEVVWRVLATYSILQFPLLFPSLRAITFQLDSNMFRTAWCFACTDTDCPECGCSWPPPVCPGKCRKNTLNLAAATSFRVLYVCYSLSYSGAYWFIRILFYMRLYIVWVLATQFNNTQRKGKVVPRHAVKA